MSSGAVVVCTWEATADGLSGGTLEALTLGRALAEALGTEIGLVVLGDMPASVPEAAGLYGAAFLDRVEDGKLGEFSPDAHVEALAQYCSQAAPKVVLLNQSFDARVIAPRVAARTRAGVVMNGVALAGTANGTIDVTTAAFGGDTRTVYSLSGADSYVVALGDNACEPQPAATPTTPDVRNVDVDLGGVEERIRVIERPKVEGPKLEDAQTIVAGGRGLGSAENFRLVEDLATALGGVAGASRPIVDDGWADSSRQVGLTGKITKPALYVAAGISGASQHMVGCSAAKTIVAINKDPDAAIFRHARYGIIGDCLEILPELVRAAKS